MSPLFRNDPTSIALLVNDMDQQGHAVIEHAFSSDDLAEMRQYVEREAGRHHGQYFAYHGLKALAGSPMARLAASPELAAILDQLHRHATGAPATSSEIFPVLRCVQGGTGARESNAFHYDATLVTLLVPVFIPEQGEERGDLIMFPNLRSVRSSVAANVIEKAVLQNKFSRRVLTHGIQAGWFKPRTLPLVPGNLYLFWGYRSLHANQPCSPEVRRATALFHYGDPHAGSLATRLILKLNQQRARRSVARSDTVA
ncbi:hypothetical protein [Pseudomonas sp. Marseille-Q5115]|uniref:hypothetical protein n=1 Tax=Pseudomonas sp. Marseille-Q5115 TaxID=2866593 RepID=UPI001CE475B9|nr:hypothetical protein [Pseudomonas sp. Marseille-Q5115]